MARSETTGRYVRRRPRVVGAGRRLRVTGIEYAGPEVGGVVSGEPIVLGGGPQPAELEAEPKAKAKSGSSS